MATAGHRALGIVLLGISLTTLVVASCGGGPAGPGSPLSLQSIFGSGTVTTNISDPPTCAAPNGQLINVWVTITRVRANVSSDADPSVGGWVDLIDFRQDPKQIDLLSLPSTTCILTQLGSTTGLPPGNYQQIRLLLLSNTPGSSEAKPTSNNCGSKGFNCVVLSDGTVETLQLSSEAQTGIKLAPGQIAGGGISLKAGQSADVNINFDACASVAPLGTGQFRLVPTLTAGAVSRSGNSISGKVVDANTTKAIAGALVLLEQPDSAGIDRVVRSAVAAPDGTFIFCPLPAGNYDVVAAATTTSSSNVTTTYNATATLNVLLGTAVGNIPLVPEAPISGPSTFPVKITGQITTQGPSNTPAAAVVRLSALQQAGVAGGTATQVTIPVFGASVVTPNLATQSGSSCPAGTACGTFTLSVPASNPQVGNFSASGTAYNPPAVGNALYVVNAQAANCTPSSQISAALPLTPGGTPGTASFAFTGCQ